MKSVTLQLFNPLYSPGVEPMENRPQLDPEIHMLNLNKIHRGMDVVKSNGRRLGTDREVMEHVLFRTTSRQVQSSRRPLFP